MSLWRPEVRRPLRFPRACEYLELLSDPCGLINLLKLDHVISENQEHEEIKSKVLGKTRSRTSRRAVLSDAQLVLLNDHNPDALASKIVRIGREQLGDDGLVGGSTGQSQRIPTRKKWDHCDVCLQLTGTKVYFGGSADFKRYHLTTKWVHVLFEKVSSDQFQGTDVPYHRVSRASVGRLCGEAS